jgi:hypothetical protein
MPPAAIWPSTVFSWSNVDWTKSTTATAAARKSADAIVTKPVENCQSTEAGALACPSRNAVPVISPWLSASVAKVTEVPLIVVA